MKNILFITFILCISLTIRAQVHEVGFFIGGSNYVGDVGSTQYINPNKPAGALIYKFNYNPRIAMRASYSFLPIGANDANAATNLKINRGISFTNTIHEVALGIEYNFYEYDISSDDTYFTPYILLEVAGFNYKNLQPTVNPNRYIFQNAYATSIPVGIGFKSRLSGAFAYAIETKIRYTFKDDLDYSSPDIPSFDFGGTGNDWYMFTGISLVYTFGRPACYSKGL